MTFRFFVILFALTFVSKIPAFAQASTGIAFEYAEIAYPGATVTSANGINNGNTVVGGYQDSQGFEHGFIFEDGRYTAVNFPGASFTEILGISDRNDMVGTYQSQTGPLLFHGFLLRRGRFTTIDDPNATIGTMAFGINKSGWIVGSYDNAHGFLLKDGSYHTIDAPQLPGEPPQTQLNGISNPGWIVGQVFTHGFWRGFWIRGNRLHFVNPLGSLDTQATGVNGRGDLVGCHDSTAGFVSFTVQNFPRIFPAQQPLQSCASSINFARDIVGSFFTLTNTNSFLAVPVLTLLVPSPVYGSTVRNPVRVLAGASGYDRVLGIKVSVNSQKIADQAGKLFNQQLILPSGNVRLVIQAFDTKGRVATVIDTITVR